MEKRIVVSRPFFLALLLLRLLITSTTLAYDPPCDTTTAEREGFREAVTRRLQETGEFSNDPAVGGFNRNLVTADTQGGVFSYRSPSSQGLGPFYQLFQSTDAILNIFCNPAPPGPAYWGTSQFLALPGLVPSLSNAVRGRLDDAGPIAELGDSINQFRLNSTARVNATNPNLTAAEDESLLPWAKTSAIITTADADSAEAIRSALISVDFPEEAINIQVIPSLIIDKISFGSPSLFASIFATSFRDRVWSDQAERARYDGYVEPTLFYSDATRVPNPFPTPTLLPRGGFENENALRPSFSAFVQAVKVHYSNQRYSTTSEAPFAGLRPEGGCVLNNRFDGCGFGNLDVAYKYSQPAAPDLFGGLHVVVGPIHTLTGLCEYHGIGFGVGITLNAEDLRGSAATLLGPDISATIPDIDFFYAFEVRRFCSMGSTEGIVCLDYPLLFPALLYGRYLERAALQRSTTTAPALDEIIDPIVLVMGQSLLPF